MSHLIFVYTVCIDSYIRLQHTKGEIAQDVACYENCRLLNIVSASFLNSVRFSSNLVNRFSW